MKRRIINLMRSLIKENISKEDVVDGVNILYINEDIDFNYLYNIALREESFVGD